MLMSLVVALPVFAAADDGTNAELEAAGYTGITALNQLKADGKFYLKNDLTVTGRQGMPSNVTLDGNGKTITYTGTNSLFGWAENVTIKNLNLEGTITAKKDTVNGGYVEGILTNGFEATKDGQKNVIENVVSNIDIEYTEGTLTYLGFLGKAQACNYEIKNVVVNGDITVAEGASVGVVGGIISFVGDEGPGDSFKISDSEFNGNITVNGKVDAAAGIVGKNNSLSAEIVDCVNNGNITATANSWLRLGGILAFSENFNNEDAVIKIDGCVNNGDIATVDFTAASYIGGIVGYIIRKANVVNCINNGDVSMIATSEGLNNGVGGIVGAFTSEDYEDGEMTVDNCWNTGAVKHDANATHAGCIVGKVHAVPVFNASNCVNTGSLENTKNAGWQGNGGIVGTIMTYNKEWHWSNVSKCDATIYNCHNLGAITGVDAAGILSAAKELFGANIAIKIDNCTNRGTINGKWQWGGGIAGSIGANGGDTVNLTVTNCVNSGAVSAQWEAGGIVAKVGYAGGATVIENCANKGTITCNENVADKCAGIIRQCSNAVTIKNCVDTTSTAYPVAPAANGNGMAAITAEGNKFVKQGAGHGTAVSQADADAACLAIENTVYGVKTSSYIFDGRQYVGTGRDKQDLHIVNDITLTVNGSNYTNATIYGNNHTVTLNGAQTFINWGDNVTVKDLKIAGTVNVAGTGEGMHVGTLCMHGFSGVSSIENVTSSAVISITGTVGAASGLMGKNDGTLTMKDCSFTGSLTLAEGATAVRALAGVLSEPRNATLINVDNSGTIVVNGNVGWGKVGGVAADFNGYTDKTLVMKNCDNSGNVTVGATSNASSVGGMLAASYNGTTTIENCTNSGTVTINNNCNVGGLVGVIQISATTIKNSTNSGAVISANRTNGGHNGIGGVVGLVTNELSAQKVILENVANTAAVSVTLTGNAINAHIGGIVGRVYKTTDFTIDTARNTGNVTYTGGTSYGWECAGGIVGGIMTNCNFDTPENGGGAINITASTYTIKNVINEGIVSSTSNTAGGILGGTKQLYVTDTADVAILIENAVNQGKISTAAGGSATGGIAGYIGEAGNGLWNVSVRNSANAGEVVSSGFAAGGIVGDFAETGATKAFTIENCVNVGYVHNTKTPLREADPWVMAAGILGVTSNPANIKNCVNAGNIATGDTTNFYGAFPIVNKVEARVNEHNAMETSLIVTEGNVYLASATLMAEEKFTDSTKTDKIGVCEAMITLNLAGFSTASLEAAIASIDSYNQNDYLKASWDVYAAAVEDASEILNTYKNTPVTEHRQNTLAEAELAILEAEAALVNVADAKNGLSELIAELNGLVENKADYINSEAEWTAIGEKITAAQAVVDSNEASNDDINNAYMALVEAKGSLVTKVAFYKALNEAIATVPASGDAYTASTWTAVQTALTAANEALESTDATVVKTATDNLIAAVGALKNKPNFTELEAAIEAAEAKNEADWTSVSWTRMQMALNNAKAALTAEEQSAVDNATRSLVTATSALAPKPDYTELQAKIGEAEALLEASYTKASWAELQTALDRAKEALESDSQSLVDEAKTNLGNAISELELKPAPAVIDYSKLEEAIEAVESLNEKEYTEESWNNLIAKLEAAMKLTSSKSQKTVDNATAALKAATEALVKINADAPAGEGDATDDNTSGNATEAPATEAPAASDKTEEKSGCGSAITATAIALTTVLALGAGVCFKKKED